MWITLNLKKRFFFSLFHLISPILKVPFWSWRSHCLMFWTWRPLLHRISLFSVFKLSLRKRKSTVRRCAFSSVTQLTGQMVFFAFLMRSDAPLMPSACRQSVEDCVKGCCIPPALWQRRWLTGLWWIFWPVCQSHRLIWNTSTMQPQCFLSNP